MKRPRTTSQPAKQADNNVIFLNFADSKVPEFKEVPNKDWVLYGEDNLYPEKLLYMFNKSSKHNAIINGKVNYIFGKGLKIENDPRGEALLLSCNRFGESLNDVANKCVIDAELFGGFYIEVIWAQGGGISDIIHKPFERMRISKDGQTFFYKKDWSIYNHREKPVPYEPFNPTKKAGSQIFYYKEYRPGVNTYPLPSYLGSLNYIECDIEISKYHLSAISNGMFPSKMIVFNNGEPTEEAKAAIEKGFKNKFTGAENSGNILLVFNSDPAQAPIIQDLSATELDKQFTILNETVQQEIFSGHGITSPSLFGVMTAGKLGESNQLQEAYDIFRNTYAEIKQVRFEEALNYLMKFAGVQQPYTLQPVEPIGFKLSEQGLLAVAPKRWILDKLGIDPTLYPEAGIPAAAPDAAQPMAQVNDTLKNLTGKQMQGLMRIVRKYMKGELTQEQASVLMASSFGLDDEQIKTMLGITEEPEDVQG